MTKLYEPLANIIRHEITSAGGMISFARYMELALYHSSGYYLQDDFSLGREGDFTTAPVISPLFAQCFANQCLQIAQSFQANCLLEIGAGTGQFASALLKSMAAAGKTPDHYYIYDISPILRGKQREYLIEHNQETFDRITWLDRLPENFTGTIIANEVLDALPVHCFEINNAEIYERAVATDDNGFCWRLAPAAEPLLSAVKKLIEEYHLPNPYQSEINLQLPAFIDALAHCLHQGVILLADYGYGGAEYYHPERNQGTLACFHQHRHHANPLVLPGLQDITAHVNFTAVAEAAASTGLEVEGFTTQAAFLLANGLMPLAEQAEQSLSPADAFQLHQAIKTLTLPTEMGDRIKIMGLAKGCSLQLQGFSMLNRLRDL